MEIDTASSRLRAYLNIRLSIVLKFQEIPTCGLAGAALTRFFPYIVHYNKISKGHNFRKELDTANSSLYAQLRIRQSNVVQFHEIPTCGLGGVALTRFFSLYNAL